MILKVKRVNMNIEQIKQIAKLYTAPTSAEVEAPYVFSSDAKLQAFANATIRAFVAEQKPVAWMNEIPTVGLTISTKETAYHRRPLYDLKGE